MIFKDEVSIEIKSGKGGAGASTFRREKFIPFGGPDGGDGGRGGNVVFKVNPHLRTLSHIHNNQKFAAEEGGRGMSKKMFGKDGNDMVIEVPEGTIIIDKTDGVPVCDLSGDTREFIVAVGGKGGRGNVWFKSSTNQSPFYAQKGMPGEEKSLQLELKMIAHIGLVGYPNAGKSTLVSKITNARPKIGNYPFTTLLPNIGVMTLDDKFTSLLVADIPGLIEGAHTGKGLGTDFLKHIERTRLILYILDIADQPMDRFLVLRNELKSYSEELFKRDFCIALNKVDMVYDQEERQAVKNNFLEFTGDVYLISALDGTNLQDLKVRLYRKFAEIEKRETENGNKAS